MVGIDIQIGNPYVIIQCLFNGYDDVIDIAKSRCSRREGMMKTPQGIKDEVGAPFQ